VPLTPAHAAAAWPLSGLSRRLPLDALIVGTMAPDFEYLPRLRPYATVSHTASGLVLFCLPAGLLVWIGFRRWVRPAVLTLLPPAMARPLAAPTGWPYVAAACAIVLGAITHDFWDACTHSSGWVVIHVAALRAPVFEGTVPGLHVYTLLQHGSTIVGLVTIGYWISRWVSRFASDERHFAAGQATRAARTSVALLAFGAVCGLLNAARVSDRGFAVALGYAAVGSLVGLSLALLGFGFARSLSK
jgi:hypothetical protein